LRVFLKGNSLMPSYGGPAFSVTRLADALADVGVDVGLWAPDQSAAATPLLRADSSVQRLTGDEVYALNSLGGVDVIHDNGMWRPHHHRIAQLAATRGIPRVVSTRGMLEPWAMSHKRWKKEVAWWLYQRHDLARARCHHATSEPEAENVRRLRLGVPVRVIPNGMDIPEILPAPAGRAGEKEGRGDPRTALFMGRIYPVKGLPMLIEAWARVRPAGWRLLIAGPDEAGHRAQVESAVLATRLGDVVSFAGPIDGPAKQSALFDADLFVLPTHSESFGMAIAEALAHGLPVLTTTAAPWPLLPERGCGWRVKATVDDIAAGLSRATSCDPQTLRAMGERGRAWVSADFGWRRIAHEFVATYEDTVANLSTRRSARS
jgi:glycosyltransferase involved in cell wall biosynthesis